jgi:prepilin-type N-terminal cleavage/methylation domain-containing protein
MRSFFNTRNSQNGFTLLELSIVLFIIGLIVVAVMKGSGLYHRAETASINQHFFQAWKDIAFDLYDRTGHVLGDTHNSTGTTGFDGYMDVTLDSTDRTTRLTAVFDNCTDVNIDPCDIVHTDYNASATFCPSGKSPFERNLIGEFSGKDATHLGFYHFEFDGNGIDTNCLVFDNVPIEVAQYIDAQVDGTAEAEHGDIRFSNATLPGLGDPLSGFTSYSATDTDVNTRGYLISIIRF